MIQPGLDVFRVPQENLDVVVNRMALVLPHVVRRVPVAGKRRGERGFVVARERCCDDLPPLRIQDGLRVPELRLPMRKDPLDRPDVPLLRDRWFLSLFLSFPCSLFPVPFRH